MVNGQTARTTRYLVTLLIIISMVGMIVLSITGDPVPSFLEYAGMAGIGFLVGTNFSNGSVPQEQKGIEKPVITKE